MVGKTNIAPPSFSTADVPCAFPSSKMMSDNVILPHPIWNNRRVALPEMMALEVAPETVDNSKFSQTLLGPTMIVAERTQTWSASNVCAPVDGCPLPHQLAERWRPLVFGVPLAKTAVGKVWLLGLKCISPGTGNLWVGNEGTGEGSGRGRVQWTPATRRVSTCSFNIG